MKALFAFMALCIGGSPMVAVAAVPDVGAVLACRGASPEKDVLIWIGKVDLPGADGVDEPIVSISILPVDNADSRSVGHAPFALAALATCERTDMPFPADARAYFDDGYAQWREAFDASNAGAWTLSPSDAYWTILGVIEP
jgi:hypothetical protein